MKKILALLLAAVMCCGMLVGCGGEQEKADKTELLPHNSKIRISDTKEDVEKLETLEEDGFDCIVSEPCKIDGKECTVTYQFSQEDNSIGTVLYDFKDATLEDVKDYMNSMYGELEKDAREGKYGPGAEGRYIVRSDERVWTIHGFTANNGATRIVISRDIDLD